MDRTLARVMDIAEAEAECIGEFASAWLKGAHSEPFHRLPVAVQRRCIQLQLREAKLAEDFSLIENLRMSSPRTPLTVAPKISVLLDEQGRVQVVRSERSKRSAAGVEVNLQGQSGEMAFSGTQIQWQTKPWKPRRRIHSVPHCELFDANKVGTVIVLRHWEPGDKFQPIGMQKPVKLQDLFTNQKIPRRERHKLIVAATRDGTLFWVEKLRISERFKVSNETIHCLHWQWKAL
jgi:tRNA(Ile)-lysidine synthetase-like protein